MITDNNEYLHFINYLDDLLKLKKHNDFFYTFKH